MSGEKRIAVNGKEINHYAGVSCFAEYVTADHRSVVKIPKEIPFDVAAVFSCAVITGVGAVVNTAKVPMGASVGIVGLGGVGLSAMLGSKASGARQIIGIDPIKYKRDGAKQLGAGPAHILGQTRFLLRNQSQNNKPLRSSPDFIGALERGTLS